MKRAAAVAAATVLLAGAGAVAVPRAAATAGSPPTTVEITDAALLAAVAGTATHHTAGLAEPTVPVEVLTADAEALRATIVALGGRVTGAVPGQLVQADMPIGQLTTLANSPGARFVQYPRRSGRVGESSTGTGVVGDEIAYTHADSWQLAGYRGSGVKVGIVDYFDTNIWDPAEQGPKPTLTNGHSFCRDSVPLLGGLCLNGDIRPIEETGNGLHGLAVAEVVKDMAPDAELYIATVNTASDLYAAVDWFAANGVTILTRSLGSAYDGPGDGTGPLDAVADHAVALGLTWFNSGGNDAYRQYDRVTVPTTLAKGSYVDFDPGPGINTWLTIEGSFVLMDGIRWSNDWYLPASRRSDYRVEFYQSNGTAAPEPVRMFGFPGNVADASQAAGASPLEAPDAWWMVPAPFTTSYIRIKLMSKSVGPVPDTIEIALGEGVLDAGHSTASGSAAKPIADSANPGVVGVGAIDPPAGSAVADYSSQGPTTDGRVKPDLSAPAGFYSTMFDGGFHGTSAASPTAAGMAALLQGAGLAAPGAATAAVMKHFTTDLYEPGADNKTGAGKIMLPDPPPQSSLPTPARYVALATPTRVLDTRAATHVGPAVLTGPYAPQAIIDVQLTGTGGIPATGVSAVVVNLTSVGATHPGYLQAFPYLRAAAGGTSTVNLAGTGEARPNFAVVPLGVGGRISVYLHAGGDVLIDVLGYYLDGQGAGSTAGRFVPLPRPERWADTRGLGGAPLPVGFATPRRAGADESAEVPWLQGTGVPAAGVDALVVSIISANSTAAGYLRADPTGTDVHDPGFAHSDVNYSPGAVVANTAIVRLGAGGTISVYALQASNIVVDVVGYITSADAPSATTGLFMPITPGRAYDSRLPTPSPFSAGGARTVQITGLADALVDTAAVGVSANLTVTGPVAPGYLQAYPNAAAPPPTSALNYLAGQTVAGGAFLALGTPNPIERTVTVRMSQTGHVIIDINGYFLP
jgi:hypothetical protein